MAIKKNELYSSLLKQGVMQWLLTAASAYRRRHDGEH